MPKHLGVCSDCQQRVSVSPNENLPDEDPLFLVECWDMIPGNDTRLNPLKWRCDPHNAQGSPCIGGGRFPEEVYLKE